MEIPKLLTDETRAEVAKAFDSSHITAALAASPAFAQFQESMRQTALVALPTMEIPKLLTDETLAAIAKVVDTSHITAALVASPAIRELSEAFSQRILQPRSSQEVPRVP